MDDTIDPRIAKVVERLEGLSTTPVKASYSLSPEILGMIEALTPSQPAGNSLVKGKTKDTLCKVVMDYAVNTVGVDAIPLAGIAGCDYSRAEDVELEELLRERGLSKEKAAEARWYLEGAYESTRDLLVSLRKSSRRGGDKVVKTFFIPGGHKELIDRFAQSTGMNKSSFLEFLIRTYWTRMRGRWQNRLFECHERTLEVKALLEGIVRDIHEEFSDYTPFEQNGFPDPEEFVPSGQDLIVAGVSNLVYISRLIDNEVLYYFAEAFASATESQPKLKK